MLCFFSFCNSQPGRVLPNYIYNERDPSISNFGGRMIDWFNWNEYFPGFICRCAEKAKLAGYDLIGVQFFGKKGNVTKCYHNCVLSLTTAPPPPPKRNKFIPFLIQNFILHANTYLRMHFTSKYLFDDWSHINSFKILFSEGTSSCNWIYRPRVQIYEWKISVSGQHSRCYPLTSRVDFEIGSLRNFIGGKHFHY